MEDVAPILGWRLHVSVDCTAIILNIRLQGEDVMKMETAGISNMSEMWSTCTRCHPNTGFTLALNFHESQK
jgi:hypothetical protein